MPRPTLQGPARPVLRRLIPWILGSTLVVLAVLAITRILWLREQVYTRAQAQLEARLEEQVQAWEDGFLDSLSAWLDLVAERADNAPSVQDKLRSDASGYLESVYIWVPARRITPDGRVREARMVFPRPHGFEDPQAMANHPCMVDARLLQYSEATPREVADAYLTGCASAPPAARVDAALSAAAVLAGQQRWNEALGALDAYASSDRDGDGEADGGLSADMTLRQAVEMGIPADRAVVFHSQRAALHMNRGLPGDEDRALNLYYQTGMQLAELDAPDAIGLENNRWALLDELQRHDRDRLHQRLAIAFEGLERRLRAYREITSQVLPEPPGRTSSEPRLIRDQYAERPYLLYYNTVRTSSGEWLGVALQLDQQMVLNDFLATATELRRDLAITDAGGTWLLGARRQPRDLAIQVPFPRTLTHLRVGMYPDAIERSADRNDEQWILPLILVTILVIIAFFALSAQISAQRRLRELLDRQREFTTRVTHELKTPIAGIKVMAETLELGAFKGDAGREAAARRIIDEADRLTSRIDEVLSSTRERKIPDPVVFDVEELLYELIDVWGPRMEQHGVRLEADLDLAPEIKGDPEAVRDAVGCLLDNALKYRDPDKDTPRVVLTLAGDDHQAVVSVADNGLGVPAKMREKIFDRFVRVEGPNRGLSGGHGLGLAQVAATARAHGGSITCTEGIDGGARFVLELRGA